MKGLFLESDDIVKYEDLSSDIVRGVNRIVDDGTGTGCNTLSLTPNEQVDEVNLVE